MSETLPDFLTQLWSEAGFEYKEERAEAFRLLASERIPETWQAEYAGAEPLAIEILRRALAQDDSVLLRWYLDSIGDRKWACDLLSFVGQPRLFQCFQREPRLQDNVRRYYIAADDLENYSLQESNAGQRQDDFQLAVRQGRVKIAAFLLSQPRGFSRLVRQARLGIVTYGLFNPFIREIDHSFLTEEIFLQLCQRAELFPVLQRAWTYNPIRVAELYDGFRSPSLQGYQLLKLPLQTLFWFWDRGLPHDLLPGTINVPPGRLRHCSCLPETARYYLERSWISGEAAPFSGVFSDLQLARYALERDLKSAEACYCLNPTPESEEEAELLKICLRGLTDLDHLGEEKIPPVSPLFMCVCADLGLNPSGSGIKVDGHLGESSFRMSLEVYKEGGYGASFSLACLRRKLASENLFSGIDWMNLRDRTPELFRREFPNLLQLAKASQGDVVCSITCRCTGKKIQAEVAKYLLADPDWRPRLRQYIETLKGRILPEGLVLVGELLFADGVLSLEVLLYHIICSYPQRNFSAELPAHPAIAWALQQRWLLHVVFQQTRTACDDERLALLRTRLQERPSRPGKRFPLLQAALQQICLELQARVQAAEGLAQAGKDGESAGKAP